MSSFITLSPGTSEQDGFFNTRKIMELESPTELVVASTAQHSAGFNGNAELGFSWAWFVAGARATLVSRWKVESPAPSPLLTGFYSSLKPTTRPPVSKTRALRQSMLAIRRSTGYQHPYYWAGFAMIGDAR
jgi:CHAT domain-containing protein